MTVRQAACAPEPCPPPREALRRDLAEARRAEAGRRRALVACGVVIACAMTAAAGLDVRHGNTVAFLATAGVAALAYTVALLLLPRIGPLGPVVFAAALLLALAGRLPLAAASPLLSDDVYRYVWDGRVQRLGYDPFRVRPIDPAFDHIHTETTRRIDRENAELPTIYPPAAQLFFRAVTAVSESALAFAVAALLCDVALGWVLLRWLAATGRDPRYVLAYAWNPLVMLEGVGGSHVDLLGALLLAAAALALVRGRVFAGSAAWAAAVAIKFLPVVLLPLLWARVRWRGLVVAAAVLAVLYVPYVTGATLPLGSLGDYLTRWRFNGPLFRTAQPWLGSYGALVLAPLAGVLLAGLLRRRAERLRSWAWPLAATLLLFPTVYPWYLLWLAPFLVDTGTAALAAWTMTSLATYAVWASEAQGAGWVLPGWVLPFEYGIVAAVAVWEARKAPRLGIRSRRLLAGYAAR